MNLIPLPFQKQYYTYLPQSPLYADITVADLPIAFHNLLNQQNGGYTNHSYVPTSHPTLDALNAVNISYIGGLFANTNQEPFEIPNIVNQNQFTCRPFIPERAIIFFEDQERCAYLRYDMHHPSQHPDVWYYDYRYNRHLWLANSFAEFLAAFEHRHFSLLNKPQLFYHIGNQAAISSRTPKEKSDALAYIRALNHSKWEEKIKEVI